MRKSALLLLLVFLLGVFKMNAQVTTSSITGTVNSENKTALAGATVVAVHVPSGTKYTTVTTKDGLFIFPTVRVGGPYKVTVTSIGFGKKEQNDVFATLGNTANVDFDLTTTAQDLTNVVVSATRNPVMNSKATGAAATISTEMINRTPVINRTVNSLIKYNAYSNGTSFGGQDSRMNNFTIDGAVFNNGFGLGSDAMAGGRTSSGAISLDAVEELQINVAPFDIKQSNFVGAAINAVTRSGTNDFNGSVFYNWNNRDLAGKTAKGNAVPRTPFDVKTYGFRLGGPIIKNKLFFFVNAENTTGQRPALDYRARLATDAANTPGVAATTAADLNDLKSFVKQNLGWDMGAIDGYNNESFSKKWLARVDYNISDKHKLTLRYSNHNSQTDVIISNSNSGFTAGNGNRNNLSSAISGQNTGYRIQDNTRSAVMELNSSLNSRTSNQFLVTYNKQIEDRSYRTGMFPTIDILAPGTSNTYTSLGFDPFTPDNKLNYHTLNITNNLTFIRNRHTITAGASFESFKSNNLFFYASNGAWVFNSIDDFKTAVLAYKANPDLAVSPVAVNRFNYRYTLLPDGKKPWQTFKDQIYSAYVQDEVKLAHGFRVTGGIRLDYINIPNTATDYANSYVAGLTFKTPAGQDYKIYTDQMPGSRLSISPRLGFNWDALGNRKLQVRGGTGLFLSRMPYVLISNQLGNNGVNIGLVNATNTTAYPFTLDPSKYKPATTDVTALRGYALNYGDQDLKFPKTWKTDLAVDYKLPAGIIGTLEFIYNKTLHALNYVDVNLKPSATNFSGADNRPYYPGLGLSGQAQTDAKFYNNGVSNAWVLTNNNKGYSYTATAKLEKPITRNWGGLLAYTHGKATDVSFVASTVNGNVPGIAGVNYLGNAYSDNDLRHRIVGNISYRLLYGNNFGGGTTFTLGLISASGGKISYVTSGDMNGDGQANDLIYIPAKGQTLNFLDIAANPSKGTPAFTAADQAAAFNRYIDGNDYLSSRRGKYAERNGGAFPWLTRMDFSAQQDFFVKVGKARKTNIIRFRADVLNFGNMLNNKWGVGNTITAGVVGGSAPLVAKGKNANGEPVYNMATIGSGANTKLLDYTFNPSVSISDVYQIQLGIRYIFGH